MRLCLIRHAEAQRPGGRVRDDADRPLSASGRDEAGRTGAALAAAGMRLDRILTSPLMRAVQTAEILSTALRHDGAIESLPFLREPGRWRGEIEPLLEELAQDGAGWRRGTVLLVGHNPDMSDLASALLGLEPGSVRLGTACGCIVDLPLKTTAAPGTLVGMVEPSAQGLRKHV
jgi:phosphohistidine phosphatase